MPRQVLGARRMLGQPLAPVGAEIGSMKNAGAVVRAEIRIKTNAGAAMGAETRHWEQDECWGSRRRRDQVLGARRMPVLCHVRVSLEKRKCGGREESR